MVIGPKTEDVTVDLFRGDNGTVGGLVVLVDKEVLELFDKAPEGGGALRDRVLDSFTVAIKEKGSKATRKEFFADGNEKRFVKLKSRRIH